MITWSTLILKISLAINQTMNELSPTIRFAEAVPTYPYLWLRIGKNIQVKMVHMIISLVVMVIFPTALKALVRGVVIAAIPAFIAKRYIGKIAGAHFVYLGIMIMRSEATADIPARRGKTTTAMKNILLEIDFFRRTGSSCILAKVGKVTFIIASIKFRGIRGPFCDHARRPKASLPIIPATKRFDRRSLAMAINEFN